MVRILTSGVFWKNYHRLTFIVHLPLPLQIMGIRFLMKVCVFGFKLFLQSCVLLGGV